jgi:hypothetical protein
MKIPMPRALGFIYTNIFPRSFSSHRVRIDPSFKDLFSSQSSGVLKNNDLRNALWILLRTGAIEKVLRNNNTRYTNRAYGLPLEMIDRIQKSQK